MVKNRRILESIDKLGEDTSRSTKLAIDMHKKKLYIYENVTANISVNVFNQSAENDKRSRLIAWLLWLHQEVYIEKYVDQSSFPVTLIPDN